LGEYPAAFATALPVKEVQVQAFVAGDDLTDRRHVASVFINGVNQEFFEPRVPRNWTAGLTVRFR
jgi:hypothetical protein